MSRRVLVFAPNWLGDAVMSLPALGDVMRASAGDEVSVAARPSVAPLFSMVPGLQRVLTIGTSTEAVDAIGGGGYDVALLFPNSFNAARLASRAGIAERWGYRGDWRSWLLTRPVSPPQRLHQTDYYRFLVRALGIPTGTDLPSIAVPANVRDSAATLLAASGWKPSRPLVVMAPGAAFGTAKQWPPPSFARVVEGLAAEGVAVAMVGTNADRATARQISSLLRADVRVIDLVGLTDLPILAGVLSHARTLVTNDSGAMHLAAAVGVNITAIFGPTIARETRPRGSGRVTILTHAVWCRPCMLRECPLTHACMTGVSPEAVTTASLVQP